MTLKVIVGIKPGQALGTMNVTTRWKFLRFIEHAQINVHSAQVPACMVSKRAAAVTAERTPSLGRRLKNLRRAFGVAKSFGWKADKSCHRCCGMPPAALTVTMGDPFGIPFSFKLNRTTKTAATIDYA